MESDALPLIDTEQKERAKHALDNGSYTCTATNATTGNGPYDLYCVKLGDGLTLEFAKGGESELEIDLIEKSGESDFHIEGTDIRGDSWEIELQVPLSADSARY